MELEEGEVPVSPSGQYLNSDTLSFTILAVLEFEVPVDNLNIIQLIKDMFISTNPRFSSIMVCYLLYLNTCSKGPQHVIAGDVLTFKHSIIFRSFDEYPMSGL